MGDPPWSAARRLHRPDVRHTAGLTWDDIQPGPGDDRELVGALGGYRPRRDGTFKGQNGNFQQLYNMGYTGESCPDDANWPEEMAWLQGRFDRNRARQERFIAWCRGKAKRRR